MAGPTACVLFPETLPNQISWRELMQDVADSWPDSSLFHIGNSTKFGGAYNGELRPFVGDVYEYQPSEYCISPAEIDATRVVLRVDISHCVELGAMCKSQCDHQLLWRLLPTSQGLTAASSISMVLLLTRIEMTFTI